MGSICDKCGGELIAGRLLAGVYLAGFMPLGEEKKFRPTRAHVLCDACSRCGAITNIRVAEPEALRLFRAGASGGKPSAGVFNEGENKI